MVNRAAQVLFQGPDDFYTANADTCCFAMTSYEIPLGRVPFQNVGKANISEMVLQGARPKLL